MSSKVIIIKSCSDCPFHSGAFTPGGDKRVCCHDKSISWIKSNNPDISDPCHWKHRVIENKKVPNWCGLDNYDNDYLLKIVDELEDLSSRVKVGEVDHKILSLSLDYIVDKIKYELQGDVK